AFNRTDTSPMSLFLFCSIFVSYFFFSYFLNHGQTLGMHYMKIRIHSETNSFRYCLKWTLYSTFLLLTLGLLVKQAKKWASQLGWGSVEVHDHLYKIMMEEK